MDTLKGKIVKEASYFYDKYGIPNCTIEFTDGTKITFSGGSSSGYPILCVEIYKDGKMIKEY